MSMSTKTFSALFIVGALVLASLFIQVRQQQQFKARVEAMLMLPEARPDAWTATADAKRMAEFKVWVMQEITRMCRETHDRERRIDEDKIRDMAPESGVPEHSEHQQVEGEI